MNSSPRKWLLADGMGALVTASMCQVVILFESYFGMPTGVMQALSGLALCLGAFSLSSYLFAKINFRKYLSLVLCANAAYCLVLALLVAIHFEKLTGFGWAYFIGELILLLVVVYLEYQVVKSKQLA